MICIWAHNHHDFSQYYQSIDAAPIRVWDYRLLGSKSHRQTGFSIAFKSISPSNCAMCGARVCLLSLCAGPVTVTLELGKNAKSARYMSSANDRLGKVKL